MQSLFKSVSQLLDEISRDPAGYEPIDMDAVNQLMTDIRQIRLEYAPPQLKFISSNFMVWYHQFTARQMAANMRKMQVMPVDVETESESETDSCSSSVIASRYQAYHRRIIEWSRFLSPDMEIVWNLLADIDTTTLAKDMDIEDEDDMLKILRNLRVNCALYLSDHQHLKDSVDDVLIFNKSLNFLEKDELLLAVTASPFIGNFDLMVEVIDRMYDGYKAEQEQKKQKQKQNNKKVDNNIMRLAEYLDTLNLPTGISYFELYRMCKWDDAIRQIINEWQDRHLLAMNDVQLAHVRKRKAMTKKKKKDNENVTDYENVKDMKNNNTIFLDVKSDCGWYKITEFALNVKDVSIDPLFANAEINRDTASAMVSQYTSDEFVNSYSRVLRMNSLLRRMGNTCQVMTLLGISSSSINSDNSNNNNNNNNQSVFLDEMPMHLHGLWLTKTNEQEVDRVIVHGTSKLPLQTSTGTSPTATSATDNSNKLSLSTTEKWQVFERFCDGTRIYLYGNCFTEQKIVTAGDESHHVQLNNTPTFIRLRSDCTMTLMRE